MAFSVSLLHSMGKAKSQDSIASQRPAEEVAVGKQPKRVLAYLQQHKSMTALDCWLHCGVYRASDAILKLRKEGWQILTDTAKVSNQFGEKCVVARYVLIGKQLEHAPTIIRHEYIDLDELKRRYPKPQTAP